MWRDFFFHVREDFILLGFMVVSIKTSSMAASAITQVENETPQPPEV